MLPDIAFLNVIHVFFIDCEKLRFSSVFFTSHVFPTFFRSFLRDPTYFNPFHRFCFCKIICKKKKSLAPSALANLIFFLQFWLAPSALRFWLAIVMVRVIVVKCHVRLGQYQSCIREKYRGKAGNMKLTGDWSSCLTYWSFGAALALRFCSF